MVAKRSNSWVAKRWAEFLKSSFLREERRGIFRTLFAAVLFALPRTPFAAALFTPSGVTRAASLQDAEGSTGLVGGAAGAVGVGGAVEVEVLIGLKPDPTWRASAS
jgi:hypothetical protein